MIGMSGALQAQKGSLNVHLRMIKLSVDILRQIE